MESDTSFKTVKRWVLTHLDKFGDRVVMSPVQGRYTYETREEAQVRLDNMLKNTSGDTLLQVFGKKPDFRVDCVSCWAGHFDPVGIYVND